VIRLPSCNPPAPVRPPGGGRLPVITAPLPETPPLVALPPELDPDGDVATRLAAATKNPTVGRAGGCPTDR
jgi:hypothetical protein